MAASDRNGLEFSSARHDSVTLPIIFEPYNGSHPSPIASKNKSQVLADDDTMKQVVTARSNIPRHPMASMQDAFAESMQEASDLPQHYEPKHSAAVRRQILLDQDVSDDTHTAKWRQRPGQQYHQLWKLMAQISFGIYLLLNGLAKDDEQVMNILQGHVDEVDEFLETTLEDFDLAQDDIEERLKFLKLPLENITIFDAMLEDRQFRLQIVNGNERIEHVIQRTAAAMKAALKDVQQGLTACKEFTIYLAQEQETASWRFERPDMEKVFDAMKGNVEGWYRAYVSLQTKGNHLGAVLVQLGSIVAEMDRRAGEISRKTRFSTHTPQSSITSSQSTPQQQSKEMRLSMHKILPSDPSVMTDEMRATLPAFQHVQDREKPSETDLHQSASPEPQPELEIQPPSEPVVEDYFLSPRVYTPVPSPKPVQEPIHQEPPPTEIKQRTSLRQRFSLKRSSNSEPVQKIIPDSKPPPYLAVQDDRSPGPRQQVLSSSKSRTQLRADANDRERTSIAVINPRGQDASLNTPPSRGLDSAYCSDLDKPGTSPAQFASPRVPPTPPILTRDFPMPSPRSDQQFFRPVQASPNSPLQRPWTAAPYHHNHIRESSNLSNRSNGSNGSASKSRLQFSNSHTPSQLGLREQYNAARERERGDAQSRMGMSMMSDMTMMTENGKKVKKKRSAFGWLKKAFSLSEEEKAIFEERRRQTNHHNDQYYERPQQRWVDGKRVPLSPGVRR